MSVLQDVHYSWRVMRRSPRVGVTVLLTLALGIGANTAIFSVVNAALLRPLPYRQPGQLVQLRADMPGNGSHDIGYSVPEFEDLRDRSGFFDEMTVSWQAPANLTGGAHPERIEFLAVSTNYFGLLGISPQLGRVFDERDKRDGFAEAAVLSDAYWHKEFGGDQNILGRRIRLDNDLYTVVGVLPDSFRPPVPSTTRPIDLWITAGFKADPFPKPARTLRFLPALIARLKPGETLEQAQSRLAAFANAQRHDYPGDYPAESGWSLTAAPLKDVVVGNSRTLLVSLLSAVALILLIACVNVANILLAQASARQRELAVRAAVGADRMRILRQLLTEAILLSLAAAVMGTLAAAGTIRFLTRALPAQLPHVNEIGIDGRVLLFSLGAACFTTMAFGLVPALRASKRGPNTADLSGRGASAPRSQTRLGKILVGAEVALSVMLLVGAGLLLKSFWALLHVEPGFQPRHLLAANVWLPVPNDPTQDVYRKPEQRLTLIREVVRRLESSTGVESAAITSAVPLQDRVQPGGFRAEGGSLNGDAPTASSIFVTADFFKTLQAPMISGRFFQQTDSIDAPLVVIVDRSAARKFWGDAGPVGRRIRLAQRTVFYRGKPQAPPWMTVVGVVNDIKLASLDEQNVPHIYFSMEQFPGRLLGVLVRAEGDKAALGRLIQDQIQTVNPNLPVSYISEMGEIASNGVGDRRFAAWLLAIFAAVALALTCVGIYGVTSYAISRRAKEMGIRSALGASREQLTAMMLRNGMLPIVLGLAAGAIAAVAAGRLLRALLFAVSSTDVAVLSGAAAMVTLVGVAANYLPARRAARVNPVMILRDE
jgi:predicted permease